MKTPKASVAIFDYYKAREHCVANFFDSVIVLNNAIHDFLTKNFGLRVYEKKLTRHSLTIDSEDPYVQLDSEGIMVIINFSAKISTTFIRKCTVMIKGFKIPSIEIYFEQATIPTNSRHATVFNSLHDDLSLVPELKKYNKLVKTKDSTPITAEDILSCIGEIVAVLKKHPL